MFRANIANRLEQSGCKIAVTGAGSWLGQASLQILENALGDEINTRVMAFGSSARLLPLASGRVISVRPLSEMLQMPSGEYLFLHYAFVTKGHIADHSLEGYVKLNDDIADTVETAARRVRLKGFFLPSSGAVYRKDGSLAREIQEHPYGAMKLRDEARFVGLAEDTASALMPVRVFNLAGPGMNNLSSFALSSIIMDIMRGDPVQIRAAHPVFRSYIHVVDLIEVVLGGLLDGLPIMEPFDTAGEVVLEVGEVAQAVIKGMGREGYPVVRPDIQPEPVDRYVGDGTIFRHHARGMGFALKSFPAQIKDTISDLHRRRDEIG